MKTTYSTTNTLAIASHSTGLDEFYTFPYIKCDTVDDKSYITIHVHLLYSYIMVVLLYRFSIYIYIIETIHVLM